MLRLGPSTVSKAGMILVFVVLLCAMLTTRMLQGVSGGQTNAETAANLIKRAEQMNHSSGTDPINHLKADLAASTSVAPTSFLEFFSPNTQQRLRAHAVDRCCSYSELQRFFDDRKRHVNASRTVMFNCQGKICGGLGDRIRGLIQVYLEAKNLGLHFTFDPNVFAGVLKEQRGPEQRNQQRNYAKSVAIKQLCPQCSLRVCEWSQYDLVKISTNAFATGVVGCFHKIDLNEIFLRSCNSGVKRHSKDRTRVLGCMWWSIFRLDEVLETAVLYYMREFSSWKKKNSREQFPTLGIHVRVGDVLSGFDVAASSRKGHDFEEDLVKKILACARATEQSMGLANSTLVVASDSRYIKSRLRVSHPSTVWTTNIAPAHVDRPSTKDRFLESMVEIMMLAFNDALLKSPSGYSNLAEAIGMYAPAQVRDLASCGINVRAMGG